MTPHIEQLACWVLRAPIAVPVANAFGAMTNRPAVFLRITASDGAFGWGEVDANPNPLRELVFPLTVEDGWAVLPDRPGLGVESDLAQLADFIVPA